MDRHSASFVPQQIPDSSRCYSDQYSDNKEIKHFPKHSKNYSYSERQNAAGQQRWKSGPNIFTYKKSAPVNKNLNKFSIKQRHLTNKTRRSDAVKPDRYHQSLRCRSEKIMPGKFHLNPKYRNYNQAQHRRSADQSTNPQISNWLSHFDNKGGEEHNNYSRGVTHSKIIEYISERNTQPYLADQYKNSCRIRETEFAQQGSHTVAQNEVTVFGHTTRGFDNNRDSSFVNVRDSSADTQQWHEPCNQEGNLGMWNDSDPKVIAGPSILYEGDKFNVGTGVVESVPVGRSGIGNELYGSMSSSRNVNTALSDSQKAFSFRQFISGTTEPALFYNNTNCISNKTCNIQYQPEKELPLACDNKHCLSEINSKHTVINNQFAIDNRKCIPEIITDFSFLNCPPPPLPNQSLLPSQNSFIQEVPCASSSFKPEFKHLLPPGQHPGFETCAVTADTQINLPQTTEPGINSNFVPPGLNRSGHHQSAHVNCNKEDTIQLPSKATEAHNEPNSSVQDPEQTSGALSSKMFETRQVSIQPDRSEGQPFKESMGKKHLPQISVTKESPYVKPASKTEIHTNKSTSKESCMQQTSLGEHNALIYLEPEVPPPLEAPPLPPHVSIELAENDIQGDLNHKAKNALNDRENTASFFHRPWEDIPKIIDTSKTEKGAICNKLKLPTEKGVVCNKSKPSKIVRKIIRFRDGRVKYSSKQRCSSIRHRDNSVSSKQKVSYVNKSSFCDAKGDNKLENYDSKTKPAAFRPLIAKSYNKNAFITRKDSEGVPSFDRTQKSHVKKNTNNQTRKQRLENTINKNFQYKDHLESQKSDNDSLKPQMLLIKGRQKKNTHSKLLKKKLGHKLPYSDLRKLSAVAKPFVSTKSSGRTSVLNQTLITASCLLPVSTVNHTEKNEEDAYNRNKAQMKCKEINIPSEKVKFHQLGLGHRTFLKPRGEEAFRIKKKYLKSSLDLGSMKHLKGIAEDIKKKVKQLEKPKSILNEVEKAIQAVDLNKFSTVSACKWETSDVDSGELNAKEHIFADHRFKGNTYHLGGKLNSFHPKLRHKIINESASNSLNMDGKMPKASVVIEKCDRYLSNGSCVNVNSEQIIGSLEMRPKKYHKSNQSVSPKLKKQDDRKIEKIVKPSCDTEIKKAKFIKGLELQQNLYKKLFPPNKRAKHSTVAKRGRFIMSTPTTFTVKPTKRLKQNTSSEVSLTEEQDEAAEDDPFTKGCEAARKCLLKRSLQMGNDLSGSVSKETASFDNAESTTSKDGLCCFKRTEECQPKPSIILNENDNSPRCSTITGNSSQKYSPLNTETSSVTGSVCVVTNISGIDNRVWDLQTIEKKAEEQKGSSSIKAKSVVQSASKILLNLNPYSSYLDTPGPLSCSSVMPSHSRKKIIHSPSNVTPNKFSVTSLIGSVSSQNEDEQRGTSSADAKVYHIEDELYATKISMNCPVQIDGDDTIINSPEGHAPSFEGCKMRNTEVNEDWKTDIAFSRNFLESGDVIQNCADTKGEFVSKPFVAIPFVVSEDQNEHSDLSTTMIDLRNDIIHRPQLDIELRRNSHIGQIVVQNSSNKLDKNNNCITQLNNSEVCVGSANQSVSQQLVEDSAMVNDILEDNIVLVAETPKETSSAAEEKILEESCKKNLFEFIIDDFMQDETFMSSWAAQTSDMNDRPNSAECKRAISSDFVSKSECSVDSKINTCRLGDMPISSPPIPLKRKKCSENITDCSRNTFVSSRTTVVPRNYKKRKFVKRFPTPLPRAKPKEKAVKPEKELYEAAKKFLGNFDDKTKRACRIKNEVFKEVETERKQATDKIKCKDTDINHEIEQRDSELKHNLMHSAIEDKSVSDKKRKMIHEEISILEKKTMKKFKPETHTHSDSSVVEVSDSGSENKKLEVSGRVKDSRSSKTYMSDIVFNKLCTGTDKKIPVLKIKKACLYNDYKNEGNKSRNVVCELKKEKTEKVSENTKLSDERSETCTSKDALNKKVFRCEICGLMKDTLHSLHRHYQCAHQWCSRCNLYFQSQVTSIFIQ